MTATDARAAARAVIAALDPVWIEPAIVQPAALYLELLGEDVRRRALMVQDDDGAELCLRPDMTVPALRAALAAKPRPAIVAYDGPVFRKQAAGSLREAEFIQIGAEWLGQDWAPGAGPEPEIVARALEGCRAVGVEPALKLGDAALVRAFVQACGIAEPWQGRVVRAAASADPATRLAALAQTSAPQADALARAAAAMDEDHARGLIDDVLSLAGVTAVGGRAVEDIVARVRARAAQSREAAPSAEALRLLAALVAIDAPLAEGVAEMERLLDHPALVARGEAQRAAGAVVAQLAALGARVDLPAQTHFAPALARNVGYYDGLVFELEHKPLGERASLGGGGRYDALARRIGGDAAVCGAGFVLRPERLAQAAGRGA
ncbi:MAG: ATP phosphoribosyltransferase regulatory subunit [Hyphomonadaceae bacterium]|nr:ATP phosphoribosyltransferase regulatory subunit [Hyphomonadaceae bacterium]